MGYIHTTLHAVDSLIKHKGVKTVADLGDQINYASPRQPHPYTSEFYKANGITDYISIDVNGKNDSKTWDMGDVIRTNKKFDLVVDAGFGEHVKNLYQCFANIHKLTKVGGYMLHENPRTKNWPEHGFHYFTDAFYIELESLTGYKILELKNTVAAHNYETGNNVFCLMQKLTDKFIEREQFPKTYTE
jgi:cyclopropane fatty-acyl-phospholipid synthase-like methyltransferase